MINNEFWIKYKQNFTDELIDYCKRNVTVVIAALNEAQTIGIVIDECQKYCKEIIVVDGGSVDGTIEVVTEKNIPLFDDNRKGKGDAMRVGASKVQTKIIVFIDADMSHDPNDIPKVVFPIYKNKIDHVIASRPKGGSDELSGDLNKFFRMIGSDIITLGINYRYNVRLTDSQNGFRAIKADVFKKLKLVEDITTIEQEMTMKTLKYGHTVDEVPSHEFARPFGDSHIRLRKVFARYIYSWIKNLI